MPIARSTRGDTLADVVERILDKGLVINADIAISLAGTELLNIKIRAALASFETAAKWGLAFPSDARIAQTFPKISAKHPETQPPHKEALWPTTRKEKKRKSPMTFSGPWRRSSPVLAVSLKRRRRPKSLDPE